MGAFTIVWVTAFKKNECSSKQIIINSMDSEKQADRLAFASDFHNAFSFITFECHLLPVFMREVNSESLYAIMQIWFL